MKPVTASFQIEHNYLLCLAQATVQFQVVVGSCWEEPRSGRVCGRVTDVRHVTTPPHTHYCTTIILSCRYLIAK